MDIWMLRDDLSFVIKLAWENGEWKLGCNTHDSTTGILNEEVWDWSTLDSIDDVMEIIKGELYLPKAQTKTNIVWYPVKIIAGCQKEELCQKLLTAET